MTLPEKQAQWIEDYRLIEDPQERLSAIVDRARGLPVLEMELRTESNRIQGCVSQVWVQGDVQEGCCHFTMASDSAMVGGLVGLLVSLYSGHAPEEIIATEPEILEALQFSRQITPTRMNGLAQVRLAIKAYALQQLKAA
ncbi:SufE family protein [bacterium]|jgi:cysteine desulfuration protein SufE|nr:SufE family protein [bacterium]MDC0312391.1 SufE family protein [Verrucomicrobiales bacterium]MDB4526951.1 SufE family protein [bacterium]MDC0504196.1 SufE family protein [Verrucomicrobiales bacterium]MDC3255145.1 SufE family protein [bacterium]